jgi:hypothetical protein
MLTSNCTEAKEFASFICYLFSAPADIVKVSAGFAGLNQTGNQLMMEIVNNATTHCAGMFCVFSSFFLFV